MYACQDFIYLIIKPAIFKNIIIYSNDTMVQATINALKHLFCDLIIFA